MFTYTFAENRTLDHMLRVIKSINNNRTNSFNVKNVHITLVTNEYSAVNIPSVGI